MFSGFLEFFTCVKEAKFDFKVIGDAIGALYHKIAQNPDMLEITDALTNLVQPLYSSLMTILVVVCLCIAFFGKKIIGPMKFVFFFVIGFSLGVHFLASLIPEGVMIPAWIIGFVVGIVSGVLYRFLYIALYAVAVGYGSYVLLYNGSVIHSNVNFNIGKALLCFIIAVVIVVFAFIFKRFVEMVGTAFLGAWLATLLFNGAIFNYAPNFVAILIPTVIIGAAGAIVQIKTRRRY